MHTHGFVTLVGAGPGDPGLLTIHAREAIQNAEVVLHDRLVGDEILALIPGNAVAIDVGKKKGDHPVPQEEINRLILEHARAGKNVVRLKGGDPYLFGRGAEELEDLRPAGVPFRVIPGISSALAAPAYAGIPVTHRDYASSVHILTGHGKNGQSPNLPFPELARLGGTLVFLMGVDALDRIQAGLIAAGMAPDTPAAIIENGTRPEQRRIDATLASLTEKARAAEVTSPAITVVGKAAALADRFDWTRNLPLWGKRILVASSRGTGGRLGELLRSQGAAVDEFAAIETSPLPLPRDFAERIGEYSWIVLTSRNGAERLFEHLFATVRAVAAAHPDVGYTYSPAAHRFDLRRLARCHFAAVGPGTADVLAQHGIIADCIPASHSAGDLTQALLPLVGPSDKLLLFRAQEGSREIDAALQKQNIPFDAIAAYETILRDGSIREPVLTRLRENRYDAVTFTSASSVDGFAGAVQAALPGFAFAQLSALCIGDVTAAAAGRHGIPHRVAPSATIEAMADALVNER